MTTTTPNHPFERAGLGVAPFKCVSIIDSGKVTTSCNYCGTGIRLICTIVSSDAKRFVVGSDCVAKTAKAGGQVQGFRDERLKIARAKRTAKREAANTARQQKWAIEREARFNSFALEHADVISWLTPHANASGFLGDMYHNIGKWGSLTEGQLKAVRASMARDAQRAADAAASNYQGIVGKPLTTTLEILAISVRTYQDVWPARTVYWHLMRDTSGNVFTMRGVSLGEKGETITGTFTVKAHEEYKGTKQTVLQRPRKLTTAPKAEAAPEATVAGITLAEHINRNASNIEREAAAYAVTHGCTIEKARDDVRGEYGQGWHEAADDARHECTDGSR